jgi:hypothetical protein
MRRLLFLLSLAFSIIVMLSSAASACTFSYVLVIPIVACGIGTVLFLVVWFGRLVLEAVGTAMLKDGKGAGSVQALLAVTGLIAGTVMILISRAFLHDRFLYGKGIGINTDPKALTIVISEGFIIITTLLSVLFLVRIFNILFTPAEQTKAARDLRLPCYALSLLYLVGLSFYGWVFYSPLVPLWKFLVVCAIAIAISMLTSALIFYPLEKRAVSSFGNQDAGSEKKPERPWTRLTAYTAVSIAMAVLLYLLTIWGLGGFIVIIIVSLIVIAMPLSYAVELRKAYEATGEADAMAALAVKKIATGFIIAVAAVFTYVLGYLLSVPLSLLLFFFAVLLLNPSFIYIQFIRPLRFEAAASRYLEYLLVCKFIVALWLVTIVFLSSSSIVLLGSRSSYKLHMGCTKNLREMSTAIGKFSADHQGRFPGRLSELTPQYLTKLPSCPAGGFYYYINLGNDWLIECTGNAHADANVKGRLPAASSGRVIWSKNEDRPEKLNDYFRNR